jgi:cell division protein FtsQ
VHRPAPAPSPRSIFAPIGARLPRLRFNRQRIVRIFLILGVIVGLIAALLVYSPFAHPRDLQVEGASGARAGRIQQAIEETAATQSTFAVSKADLMKAVAAYPEVADIKIASHPPFRLDLAVVMRPPVATVLFSGRTFQVAADGTVLRTTGGVDVPRLDLSVGSLVLREGHVTGGRDALKVLAVAPAAILPLARAVRVTEQTGLVVEMERGPRLIFGDAEGARDKWRAALTVIADGSAAKASYIDLRVPGRPAVGGIGGSRTAGFEDLPSLTAADDAGTSVGAEVAQEAAATGDTATAAQAQAETQSQTQAPAQSSTAQAETGGETTATPPAATATSQAPAEAGAEAPVSGGAAVGGGVTP